MSNKPKMKKKQKAPQVSPLNPNQAQDISPEKRKQIETAMAAATHMIYAPETKAQVQQMIKGQEAPEMSIPMATNAIFDRFEGMAKKGPGEMPLDVKLPLGVHIFGEVLELAEAMQVIPPDLPDEAKEPMLRASLQQYIQKGLKDKSIDPIELQHAIEPLLSQEEMTIGQGLAKAQNVPGELTKEQGMQGMLQRNQMPLQAENATLKKQMGEMQGALQGVAQGGQNGN